MQRKAKIIIPVCAALGILYITLAARHLPEEIQFTPVLITDTELSDSDSSEAPVDFSDAIPFKLGQNIGYIDSNGNILNKLTFPYKASISSEAYVLYGTSSSNIDFFTPDGKKAGTIQGTGFPFFTEHKKYNLLPGGQSFAFLNDDGSEKWIYEGSTPITAFSSSTGGTVAGFADGSVIAFDDDGNIRQTYKPGGSSYEVILGAAISNSAKYTATLSGQNNQRFVISERISKDAGSSASIIFYKTMNEELNRQVLIRFSSDEKKVFYDCAGGLGIVDISKLRDSVLPISGKVLSIKESDSGKEFFILSKKDRLYTITVIEGFDVLAGTFSFEADCAFISTKGNSLFVGRDSKISKINIEHK